MVKSLLCFALAFILALIHFKGDFFDTIHILLCGGAAIFLLIGFYYGNPKGH